MMTSRLAPAGAVLLAALAACPQAEAQDQPPPRSQSLLNPAISVVFLLTGVASVERQSDANGFDLSEAEFAFQSAVDPFTRVDLFVAFPSGESPEVEEGFVVTTALPGPFQIKGGRFKNAFGKWNLLHGHSFFTVDRPDALDVFGEESLATDGLSISALVKNPWDLYIESLSEIGMATEGAAFNSGERRHLTWVQHLTGFFPTSAHGTLEIGLSAAGGRTGPSEATLAAIEEQMLGDVIVPRAGLRSRAWGADVTFKWRPLDRNRDRSFLWQSEWLKSRRDLETLEAGPALVARTLEANGGYSYLEWQLARRWRLGGRYDRSRLPDDERARVTAASAVVRFHPSEFQELRFQVKRIERNAAAALALGEEEDDTRVLFQWIPVIGAHGAHKY